MHTRHRSCHYRRLVSSEILNPIAPSIISLLMRTLRGRDGVARFKVKNRDLVPADSLDDESRRWVLTREPLAAWRRPKGWPPPRPPDPPPMPADPIPFLDLTTSDAGLFGFGQDDLDGVPFFSWSSCDDDLSLPPCQSDLIDPPSNRCWRVTSPIPSPDFAPELACVLPGSSRRHDPQILERDAGLESAGAAFQLGTASAPIRGSEAGTWTGQTTSV
jgi:hypothetical protein